MKVIMVAKKDSAITSTYEGVTQIEKHGFDDGEDRWRLVFGDVDCVPPLTATFPEREWELYNMADWD